ncbi:L-threonylcarbamoyladenylate synthase [Thermomicrobium sp. 4228-Ro]|uniref:L-threonylcarbamoyladenylate synthase n=1 Tax=Thermomicrobium sp. 4228-Ro TaxID=2993937 RepID=UPI00224945C2|nr:L-threonylcarbamoyladenylate synthase [Thermomicrobium sp. 4228-Ro]MCX2726440.1 L-threonylcarbamoyladenylate synthase [Thermomicrobium sp. 4228-Ro]
MRVIAAHDAIAIDEAARVLREGGLVVFPTDTVYGVGAAVDRPDAVARLYVAKGRPLDRPIPVLIADLDQLERLASEVNEAVWRLARRFWPGALTVVVPAQPWLPVEIVRDTGAVGLRMPDHPVALAIIRAAGGAVATTSANRSGEREACTVEEAIAALGEAVDLYVDGGRTPGGIPSTVVALEGGKICVLRRGVLDPALIEQALRES